MASDTLTACGPPLLSLWAVYVAGCLAGLGWGLTVTMSVRRAAPDR
ncbi:hypothetical protein MAA8898_05123 [Maliponia aquimaris]|uniref:Uncharacterized protein n=1 Tax=Maliponia aquimaris TaxID=1673631 RepID=A0A238L9C7_9RHOB|nr:hypothetical protein MAA8898_05123 [Maliponia aquimaris]